jgi:hypothetical protein
MTEQPDQETIGKWHRRFAAECNNRAWELASQGERSEDKAREMLFTAFASVYHWSQAGTPLNEARADVLLAHVHSILRVGDAALWYARRSLDFFEGHECEDWDLAFAHAEMAFAAAVTGDAELYARHYAEAQARGHAIAGDEDRAVFLEELARIPGQV